jgi:hypothetical protein
MSTDLKRRRLQNHGGTPHPEGALACMAQCSCQYLYFFFTSEAVIIGAVCLSMH